MVRKGVEEGLELSITFVELRGALAWSVLAHAGEPVRITVRPPGAPASTFRIDEAGTYSLEGDLPADSTADGSFRLDVRCDPDPPPTPDRTCLSVSSASLH